MWHLKNKVPEDVSKAMWNLRDNDNYRVILAWLRSALKEEDTNWRAQADVRLLQVGQGRAQSLDAVLNANDTAEEVMRRLLNP